MVTVRTNIQEAVAGDLSCSIPDESRPRALMFKAKCIPMDVSVLKQEMSKMTQKGSFLPSCAWRAALSKIEKRRNDCRNKRNVAALVTSFLPRLPVARVTAKRVLDSHRVHVARSLWLYGLWFPSFFSLGYPSVPCQLLWSHHVRMCSIPSQTGNAKHAYNSISIWLCKSVHVLYTGQAVAHFFRQSNCAQTPRFLLYYFLVLAPFFH
jgi:hypothetical protein